CAHACASGKRRDAEDDARNIVQRIGAADQPVRHVEEEGWKRREVEVIPAIQVTGIPDDMDSRASAGVVRKGQRGKARLRKFRQIQMAARKTLGQIRIKRMIEA